MRDLYSNDVETAARLAEFEELPAERDEPSRAELAREARDIPVTIEDFRQAPRGSAAAVPAEDPPPF